MGGKQAARLGFSATPAPWSFKYLSLDINYTAGIAIIRQPSRQRNAFREKGGGGGLRLRCVQILCVILFPRKVSFCERYG